MGPARSVLDLGYVVNRLPVANKKQLHSNTALLKSDGEARPKSEHRASGGLASNHVQTRSKGKRLSRVPSGWLGLFTEGGNADSAFFNESLQ